MTLVTDIHTRTFAGDLDSIGAMLDTLAGPADNFWVTDLTPPMILDRGLAPGSRGGHGAVRYSVVEYIPRRSVTFRFDPSTGLNGTHRFSVESAPGGVTVTHELRAELSGAMRILWRPLVLPMHSGVIEDIFDHLERGATGIAHRQRPTGPALRWLSRRIAALESASVSRASVSRPSA